MATARLSLSPADDAKYGALVRLHALGLSQRDVATEVGMSQRWVCSALKRFRLAPNGYHTPASRRKRSASAASVHRSRRVGAVLSTLSAAPPWEALWPLESGSLSPRTGYHAFAALCRLGVVEHAEEGVQILPRDDGLLVRASDLRLRELVGLLTEGTTLNCAGQPRLKAPLVRPCRPSRGLSSWCVTVKDKTDEPSLSAWLTRELIRLGIGGKAILGPRRVIKIKGRLIVGYAVEVRRLHRHESLLLQSVGLGGRRRFGCGVFVPC